MAFEFPPNTKFAAMHLSGCSRAALPAILLFDGGFSAHSAPVMVLTDLDKRQIGESRAEQFNESNVVLMASMVSETPGILDGETLELASEPKCSSTAC